MCERARDKIRESIDNVDCNLIRGRITRSIQEYCSIRYTAVSGILQDTADTAKCILRDTAGYCDDQKIILRYFSAILAFVGAAKDVPELTLSYGSIFKVKFHVFKIYHDFFSCL